ncbi:splicing regulatory glutamine/lysine-rich protein [Salix suchowensis]|nr:splicing regulatory glutamine/lysine-rich protein [Salix suchowensis]
MAKDQNGAASDSRGDVVENSRKSKDKSRQQNPESESHRRRKSRDSIDSESESEYEDTKRTKTKRKSRKRHRSRRSSDSESESESDYSSESEDSERRRRKRKERKRREREEEKERKRRKREKEKKRERKEKEKKKKEKGKTGAVTNSWGKYGIIRETDMWNKRPEFTAWLAEVKQVNLESLPNWEEKQMFKQFMEDHNTATFPSKKYYNLDAYYHHKMEKELKKGIKKVVAASERTVFNDEEQRRQEQLREREKQKEAEVEALKCSMQSGMAQAMKEQARLREEMAYQYKLGNFEAAAAIQRRLDPDVAM